jgi:tetratricopeptide (TPR) repeat protein
LLRGDLDCVVLKALRKDPRERYPSVFGLTGDLQAWLGGHPVTARPDTLAYRARKFVVRHRTGVAAALIAAVAIVAGGASTAWQARIARVERDKAQNRFRDVRQFSRSLLFEVHESLRTLPGATEPRRLLLARAVQFLDRLAADAGNDDQLTLELAEGYRRLGQVQGSSVSENVGDVAGAIASFEKAVRLGEGVLARHPHSLDAVNVATGAHDDVSSSLLAAGRIDDAERAFARHLALVEELTRQRPSDPRAQASIAASLLNLGTFRATRRDLEGARPFYERAVTLFEALPEAIKAERQTTSPYSFALKRLGALHLAAGRLDEGERR